VNQSQNRILTAPEAAKRLGISPRTLDRLSDTDPRLRKIKISSRRIGYSERAISEFIEAQLAA